MITTEQIEQQILLEREAIKHGINKLNKNTMKSEQRNSSSLTIYGVTSIQSLLPLVTEIINDTFEYRIKRGHSGVAFKDIHTHLSDVDHTVLAAIACKTTFDLVFSYKDKANTLASVSTGIGRAIEQELQLSYYEKQAPGMYHTIAKNYQHAAQGTRQKFSTTSVLMDVLVCIGIVGHHQ